MVFGEIEAFISITERLYQLKKFRHDNKCLTEIVPKRFFQIFKSHGVHRSQIPRIIGHSISLSDVQSEKHIFPKLTEEIIKYTCEIFNINRNWLDGVSDKIHPTYDFYKKPLEFKGFIENLLCEKKGEINGVLLNCHNSAILLFQEEVVSVENNSFYRYYLCTNWSFSYWKSRSYLTACVACCYSNGIDVRGLTVSSKYIESIAYGKSILGWGGKGVWSIDGKEWNVEEIIFSPTEFLKGIDLEEGNVGAKFSISLWLEIAKDNEFNFLLKEGQKEKFITRLKKYS